MGSISPIPAELDWEDGARQINDCEYLYLDGIREIEELTLELMVREAKVQDRTLAARDDSAVKQLLAGSRPIETDPTCRVFQLVFDRNRMVSYTVLNESYGKYPEPPEQFTGKLFRIFSWSHLLDFTKRTTYWLRRVSGCITALRDRMPQSCRRRNLRRTAAHCKNHAYRNL